MKNKNKKRVYMTRKRKLKKQKQTAITVLIVIMISAGVIGRAEINAINEIGAISGDNTLIGYKFTDEANKAINIYPEPEDEVKKWVLTAIYEAGLDPDKAERLIECESKWKPDVHGVNWSNKKGVDRGLWQISSLYHSEVSNADAYDYKKATVHAIRIIKERGWQEWTCGKLLNL